MKIPEIFLFGKIYIPLQHNRNMRFFLFEIFTYLCKHNKAVSKLKELRRREKKEEVYMKILF